MSQQPKPEITDMSRTTATYFPKKKRTGWYIASGLIILLIGIIWYNKPLLWAYYLNARYNTFKPGDKMYTRPYLVNDPRFKSFTLSFYHKLRPINQEDIDNMDGELWKKELIKKNLSSSDKPYLAESAWGINTDSLCKYKTALLGTYAGSEILNVKLQGKYIPVVFFIIKPNRKALNKDEAGGLFKIPDNYREDDGPFYIEGSDAQHEESKTFRNIN
jgi:hypothetical protein